MSGWLSVHRDHLLVVFPVKSPGSGPSASQSVLSPRPGKGQWSNSSVVCLQRDLLVGVIHLTEIPGRVPYHRFGAALGQKTPPVAGKKLHLAVRSLVRHELLWIRQGRQGFGFSLVASKQCSSLGGRDHLVPLMSQQQKLIGSEAIRLWVAGRLGDASVVWERRWEKIIMVLTSAFEKP